MKKNILVLHMTKEEMKEYFPTFPKGIDVIEIMIPFGASGKYEYLGKRVLREE